MNAHRVRKNVHIPTGVGEISRPYPDYSIRIDGVGQRVSEVRRSRLVAVAAFFIFAFGALVFQLVSLSVSELFREDRVVAVPQTKAASDLRHRGDIVDRNGILIATDIQTVSLFANAREIHDANVAADALSVLFPEVSRERLVKRLSSNRAFVWLKRGLTPSQHSKAHALGIPGLYFREDVQRIYPNGPLVSQTVGYVDIDNRGIAGLEKSLEDRLTGENRQEAIRVSLDVRVQHIVREEVMAGIASFKAKAGVGLVVDVNNGDVLSMISLPDFDPNNAAEASSLARFNQASLGVYEMGSTFKAFNTAMVLDAGIAGLDDQYDASKPYRVASHTIRDFHGKNKWLTVSEVFMYSSNIGSAKMAHDAGTQVQRDFLQKLGLFDRSPIEIPEVGRPIVPVQWGPAESATVSYGHGIAVSPIQVTTAISALVNGGRLVQPSLLMDDVNDREAPVRVISEETSRVMRRLMRRVVVEGTGKKAQAKGYSVAGKTGTAEKPSRGGYNRKDLLTSFVAVFPSSRPRYLVLVILDEPRGNKETHGFATAGWTAAPISGRIVERIAPVLGVKPEYDWVDRIQAQELAAQQGQ